MNTNSQETMRRLLLPAVVIFLLLAASPALATVSIWQNDCSEDQVNNSEVGDGSTDSVATGSSDIRYEDTSDELSWNISWLGLEANLTAIHIHGPAAPSESAMPHFFNVFSGAADVIASGLDRTSDTARDTVDFSRQIFGTGGTFQPSEVLAFMNADSGYTNIHSAVWPTGEIRCNMVKVGDLEPQTKGQQKCLKKIEKSFSQGFSKGTALNAACVKARDKTEPEDDAAYTACVTDKRDPGWAAIAAKASSDLDEYCRDGNSPTLDGPVDPTDLDNFVLSIGPSVWQGVEVVTLRSGLAPQEYTSAVGKCRTQALLGSNKCAATAYKNYATCAKKGRAGKLGVSFVLSEDLQACVFDDPKGKVAKACDAGSKLEKNILKHCVGVSDLALAPENADPAASAALVATAGRCAACLEGLSTAYLAPLAVTGDLTQFATVCDLADDGLDNASCTGE
jgi:hypothetical protein